MEDNARLRKGHERKLRTMVDDVEAVMREMEGKVVGLEEVREELDKSAAQVLQQIHALFHKVAQHKHELEEGVEAVRREAFQPLSDAANACHVLVRVVRNAEGCRGGGMFGEEEKEHIGFALVVGEATAKGGRGGGGGRRRVALVEFVAPGGGGGGGTAHGALDRWKEACRLCLDVAGGEWEAYPGAFSRPLPRLNTSRLRHAAAVVTPSNHVFVVGGHGRYFALDSVERLREGNSNSAWEEEAGLAIPTARDRCGACAVGTAVIVVGGRSRNDLFDVAEAVDTASGVHTTLPPLPNRVNECGVVSVQGKVIVTGGHDGLSILNTVWALDVGNDEPNFQQPLQWASLPSMAQARGWHGAAAGGGCVFVCGGSHNNDPLDSCEMLRMAVGGEDQGGWEALPPMPQKLYGVGCCYGGGNVFVVGGDPDAQRSLFALSVRERRWAQVAELAEGRFACAAVCVGRRVMVLGGSDGELFAGCEVFEF